MLSATRVISRKALECSGIGSDFYTQRNLSTIIKNVSDHFQYIKRMKGDCQSEYYCQINSFSLFYINLRSIIPI